MVFFPCSNCLLFSLTLDSAYLIFSNYSYSIFIFSSLSPEIDEVAELLGTTL